MAAYRCSLCARLLLLLILLLYALVHSEEIKQGNIHHVSGVNKPQTPAETVERPLEERQCEATEVNEAVSSDAAAHLQDYPGPDSVLTSTPQLKDDFREELVIRPLHSGDIYASFQFRTVWETDFTRGSKGKQLVLQLWCCQNVTTSGQEDTILPIRTIVFILTFAYINLFCTQALKCQTESSYISKADFVASVWCINNRLGNIGMHSFRLLRY